MEDYQNRRHMSLVPNPTGPGNYIMLFLDQRAQQPNCVWYLTDQLKTTGNDVPMVGPKLQTDLIDVLLTFRTKNVAITADIAQIDASRGQAYAINLMA